MKNLDGKERIIKHRAKKSLENGGFITTHQLKTLIDAKVDVKDYVKQFKKNIDNICKK